MGEWPTCGRWGRTSDPGDMAAPMAAGPQLESREPVAGRCGLLVCLPQRCPLVLLDCPLFSTPFLPALAPCMEQGLHSGFLPEVTLAFMGKSALCSKHYQQLELTPRTPGSYRDIGSRGMDTGPTLELFLLLPPRGVWRAALERRVWDAALGLVFIRVFSSVEASCLREQDTTRFNTGRVSATSQGW